MVREEVQKILTIIASTYPNFKVTNKTMTVDVWTVILRDEPYEKIESALYAFIKNDNSGFAPTIGQLLNIYDSIANNELDGNSAWSLVYKAICNSAYNSVEEFEKLPDVVKLAVGCPDDLRRMATDSSLNIEVEKSHFLRAYSIAMERKKCERLVGIGLTKAIGEHKNKLLEGE